MEPSGPVQACNGIALPLPLPLLNIVSSDRGLYHLLKKMHFISFLLSDE
jgi:hypothetical protein